MHCFCPSPEGGDIWWGSLHIGINTPASKFLDNVVQEAFRHKFWVHSAPLQVADSKNEGWLYLSMETLEIGTLGACSSTNQSLAKDGIGLVLLMLILSCASTDWHKGQNGEILTHHVGLFLDGTDCPMAIGEARNHEDLVDHDVQKLVHVVVNHVQAILCILGVNESSVQVLKKVETPTQTVVESILKQVGWTSPRQCIYLFHAFTVLPLSIICLTIWPCVNTFSVHFTVLIFSIIFLTIWLSVNTFSMSFAILPLPRPLASCWQLAEG